MSVLGCGWLGLPLAATLVRAGYRVKGSTTSADKSSLLTTKGIDAYTIRLEPQPEGDELSSFLASDALIITVPPRASQMGEAFYPQQIQHLAEALRQSAQLPYTILISSTSIYPETNGEAREGDVTRPDQSAAPALVEGEERIRQLRNTTILRCGGLMGYDRIPGKYVAGKQDLTTGRVPVNYLHRDDAIGTLQTLLLHPQPGEVFNAVAPLHPTREEVYRKSCEDFGYALPTFAEPTGPTPFKVISNEKLMTALPYTFQYTDPLQFFYSL